MISLVVLALAGHMAESQPISLNGELVHPHNLILKVEGPAKELIRQQGLEIKKEFKQIGYVVVEAPGLRRGARSLARVVRDRLHHEVGRVADVGVGAHEDRAGGDGLEDAVRHAGHLRGQLEALAEREEREVGRRVVQHARERASAPVELHLAVEAELVRVESEVIQCGNHRREDAHEEPGDFLHRPEREVVRLVHGLRRSEVGADGGDDDVDDACRRAERVGERAPIARLADQVSARFVPLVIGIAIATLAIWLVLGPSPSATWARDG